MSLSLLPSSNCSFLTYIPSENFSFSVSYIIINVKVPYIVNIQKIEF
jgi:hypothetical protein